MHYLSSLTDKEWEIIEPLLLCRLPKLLSDSREYQAEVSNKLANQVLDALWELLRGFQIADAGVNGKLLGEIARSEPQHIYGGFGSETSREWNSSSTSDTVAGESN